MTGAPSKGRCKDERDANGQRSNSRRHKNFWASRVWFDALVGNVSIVEGERVHSDLPLGLVRICIGVHMFSDVPSRLVARWITGYACRSFLLIDPDVIETHLCRHKGCKTCKI